MRWYKIASGILLILPIIDFALAVPVIAQDKCQTCVDEEHRDIPEHVISVLGKRFDVPWGKYFRELWKKPKQLSAPQAPSSSVPSGSVHGSTDVVQAPAQPASSTKDPLDLAWDNYFQRLQEKPEGSSSLHATSSSAPSGPVHGSPGAVQALAQPASSTKDPLDLAWDNYFRKPQEKPGGSSALHAPPSSAPSSPVHESTDVVQAPAQNSPSSTKDPLDSLWDNYFKKSQVTPEEPHALSSSAPSSPVRGSTGVAQAPVQNSANPGPSNPRLSTKLDSDRNLLAAQSPPPSPMMPPRSLNIRSPKEPEDNVAHGPPPPPIPASTDPELHLDHQSLSTDSQPADLLDAVKGKAKESRRVSSAARDVGNAAERELQRSLDPGV